MKTKIKNLLRKVDENIHIMCVSLLFFIPNVSHAATIQSVIDKAVGYLQGGLARSVGVGAIVVMGYLCLAKQKFPKEAFIWTLVGLGLIFGASSLYSAFTG